MHPLQIILISSLALISSAAPFTHPSSTQPLNSMLARRQDVDWNNLDLYKRVDWAQDIHGRSTKPQADEPFSLVADPVTGAVEEVQEPGKLKERQDDTPFSLVVDPVTGAVEEVQEPGRERK